LTIECLSGSDGKEGIAKAANLLYLTYLNDDTHGNGKREPTFTEADMASALKAVGMLEKVSMICLVYLFSFASDFINCIIIMCGAFKFWFHLLGCGGPEPDLLLMYGPARCHLGFPAWRLRYTEIM
jgi:ditrans,polycis-polyprenyl diphosphate synthase